MKSHFSPRLRSLFSASGAGLLAGLLLAYLSAGSGGGEGTAARHSPPGSGGPPSRSAAQSCLQAAAGAGDTAGLLRLVKSLAEAAAEEMPGLLRAARGNRQATLAVFQRWADTDPAGAMRYLTELPAPRWESYNAVYNTHDEMRDMLFQTWAHSDPDAAWRAVSARSGSSRFRNAQWAIFSALLEREPEKAFALAATAPGMEVPAARVTDDMFGHDPARFLKAAVSLHDRMQTQREMQDSRAKSAALWAEREPQAAVQWALTASAAQRLELLPQMMSAIITKQGPAAGAALFATLPASPEREAAGRRIAQAMAQTDPRAALGWLQENLNGGRNQAFQTVIETAAGSGTEGARRLTEELEPGSGRDHAIHALARVMAKTDAHGAAQWLASLPPDPARLQALGAISGAWVESDGAGVRAWIKSVPAHEVPPALVAESAEALAGQSSGDAMKWAATLPPSLSISAACVTVSRSLLNEEAPPDARTLNTLPPAAAQQAAATAAGMLVSLHGLGEAQKWVAALPPSLRAAGQRALSAAEP